MVVKKSVVRPASPEPKEDGHWEWVADAPKEQKAKDATKEDQEEAAMDDDEDAPVNFLQVDRPHAAARKKLVAFLTSKSQALKSTALSTLLIKLREANSPFQKVKQMIMDMITRLENEAANEANEKAWCDQQMSDTTAERDEAQMHIEDYNALLTEKNALVSQLTEQIATLGQEIADLQKALNEETEIRNNEKATNEQTIADAQAGEQAVNQALTFLRDFYSGAASLLQQAPPAEGYQRFSATNAGSDGQTVDDMAPDSGGVDGNYEGNQDASKSIIGLLEVIESDFQNAQSTTTSDENAAVSAYNTFKSETETDISDKNTLKNTKTDQKTTAKLDITQAEADLKSEKTLHQQALDELDKLKPVCVDTGMSWEERTKRREQEIDSLKTSLKILQNTDFGF